MSRLLPSAKRRDFLKGLASLGLLTFSPFEILAQALGPEGFPDRLSWKAFRGTNFEGSWTPTEIEGKIPENLNGHLFRIGPGTKKNNSTRLTHFLDGDAYLTAFDFAEGQVSVRSRFLNTAERADEKAQGQMLYHEYGTRAPGRAKGFKNSPNIHFVKIGKRHLALSEAAHPYLVDPKELKGLGPWNFRGQLEKHLSFTAHPKNDPFTGNFYAYGLSRSLSPKLKVFKIDSQGETLTELHVVGLGGFYPVHDMLLTENYIIFVVPPLKINLLRAALGNSSIAELLEYEKSQPLRILVMRKDGRGGVTEIPSQPSGMVFHHFNAYEDGETGNIIFDSIVSEDDSAFKLFKAWSKPSMPKGPSSWITRFEVDPKRKKLVSRKKLSDGAPIDFPCVDPAKMGRPEEHYYALEARRGARDPLAFDTLVYWNMNSRNAFRLRARDSEIFGEPVYVPLAPGKNHSDAWILHMGYDGTKDQSFLDVRYPVSLKLEARIWLGHYVPLGFHGSFI